MQTVNITWMQYGHSKDQCLCVESFTYTHTAVSPVFDFDSIGYDSESYSTWTESVLVLSSSSYFYGMLTYIMSVDGPALTFGSIWSPTHCKRLV